MPITELLLLSLAVLAAAVMSRVYASSRFAQRVLDRPNARSAHQLPVPSGGGIAWLTAFILVFAAFGALVMPWSMQLIIYTVLALVLGLVGWLDDRRGISVRWRLLIYAIASLLLLAFFRGQSPSYFTASLAPTVVFAAAVVGVLWLINLYNFMDGIDGLAAAQTLLFSSSFALFCWVYLGDVELVTYSLLLAAVNLGFLWVNWSPAALFMGDAGSIPSGFLVAAISTHAAFADPLLLVIALILLSVFISDASVTLFLRGVHGEHIWQAHSGHAYQRLARQFASHSKVVVLLFCIFSLWLLPLAWCCVFWPEFWLYALFAAYLPVIIGVAAVHRFT